MQNRRMFLKKLALFTGGMILPPHLFSSQEDDALLASFISDIDSYFIEDETDEEKYEIISETTEKIVTNIPDDYKGDKYLHLINTHTGEEFSEAFEVNGELDPAALKSFNFFMRDFRTGSVKDIDWSLLEILYAMKVELDTDKPFHVLSGYRTRKTNEMLRKRSKYVAKRSLHVEGRAADIVVPGRSIAKVARVARSLRMGGVGEYRKSHFIHIDTGRVRHWRL